MKNKNQIGRVDRSASNELVYRFFEFHAGPILRKFGNLSRVILENPVSMGLPNAPHGWWVEKCRYLVEPKGFFCHFGDILADRDAGCCRR